jgi:hypothetical protein
MIDNVRSTLFMFTPQRELIPDDSKRTKQGEPPFAISSSGSSARIRGFAKWTSQRRDFIGLGLRLSAG